MTIFDLLSVVAFLTFIVVLIASAISAIRGRRAQALKILRIFGVCAAGYLAIGVTVAFLKPQRVIRVGEPWCFDDWCLTLERVSRTSMADHVSYTVDLRIFSTARRVSQRAQGVWIYLIDNQGHRYSPEPDSSGVPLDVLLHPLESVTTSRVFRVPADVQQLGLITGHGPPYCTPIDILIIGGGSCFVNKPTMIRIQ